MRRTRKVLAAMLVMAPMGAATLLGCKSYDDLMKELSESGVPVMTSVVPASAKVGEVITVRGANFGTAAGRIGFDDAALVAQRAEVVSWNSDFVVTKVPSLAGAPSVTKIRLMNSDGKEAPLPMDFTIAK